MKSRRENFPRVTIVVPTFERGHLIVDALESIREQTIRPLEIIVVDDGSTDDTQNVVAAWYAKKGTDIDLHLIRQSNLGGNAARNAGIRAARAPLVAFLDSDDEWHPEKLQKQLEVFARNADFGAVYCGVVETDLERRPVVSPSRRRYPEGQILDKLLISDVTAPTSAFVVRRDVFDRVGLFDIDLEARQDWDMWIRTSSVVDMGAVPEALVNLRHHDGPRTQSDPEREIRAYRAIRRKSSHLLKRQSVFVRAAALSSYYRRIGRVNAWLLDRPGYAFLCYIYAICIYPFEPNNYAALVGLLIPKNLRKRIRTHWNRHFGATPFSIRSH